MSIHHCNCNGLFAEADAPTERELRELYDLIAEGRAEQAVKMFHELFGDVAELLTPSVQQRIVGLRRAA